MQKYSTFPTLSKYLLEMFKVTFLLAVLVNTSFLRIRSSEAFPSALGVDDQLRLTLQVAAGRDIFFVIGGYKQ